MGHGQRAAVDRAPVPGDPGRAGPRVGNPSSNRRDGDVSTIISRAGRAELAMTRCLRDRVLSHGEFVTTPGCPRPGTACPGRCPR